MIKISLCLKVLNAQGEILAQAEGDSEITLFYDNEYSDGDCLCIECSTMNQFLVAQLDDTLPAALVFLKNGKYLFPIPFGSNRTSYSPRSFTGTRHLLYARIATTDEVSSRRNLAFNPLDTHDNTSLFPHASANVETRNEAVFAARNAIDGLKANHSHGEWPFTSWGINKDPKAAWKIEFGRKVVVNKVVFYLRADFPHDAWWKSGTLHFSDGSSLTVHLEKTDAGQPFWFESKNIEWVTLDTLVKAEDPSPFPALTQIEFYGREY